MAWSREIVSNIEQGRRDVTVADLVLIARALDVDPEKLFRRILRW
jgi:transcriptional regulator with XRE-family HTH domain